MTQLTGVTLGNTNHLAVFKGRYKYIYGINGATRGFRWDGSAATVQPIGLSPPPSAVTMGSTLATTSNVASINITTGGVGYTSIPTVTFSGGGGTGAKAQAQVLNGAISKVIITAGGTGYTSPPQVSFSGGQGSGASLGVAVDGGVVRVQVVDQGVSYTSATIGFANVTGAVGSVDVFDGKVTGVRIINPGSGATTTAAATIYGDGTSAAVECVMSYKVVGLTVVSAGTGYSGKIPVKFVANSEGAGSGAVATLTANTSGGLASPVVTSQGDYAYPPTAVPNVFSAEASALVRSPQKGSYRCCIRYVDDTPEDEGGPIPSVITDLVNVDAVAGTQSFNWSWSTAGAEGRAQYVELWRTSSNQAITLYRVAKLPRVAGVLPTSYSDTLSEEDLLSPTRADYALMPITLPSGQLNARRFAVPPSNMEDACWFQDRAWFAVNTDGTQPNTLLFSEVDEPESVPDVNEVILQENTGVQDRITAIIPFGAMLIIGQSSHIYKLQYVQQPIIDASVMLVGYRGILNKRCWSSLEGVLFCVDSYGMYAFDGSSIEPVSAAIDDYWRTSVIDFSKAKNFFVHADTASRVVRFHYCKSSDGNVPSRALCYCLATKSWWEESYGQQVGATAAVAINGKQTMIAGLQSGGLAKMGYGLTDFTTSGTTGVGYQLRTPPMLIVNSQDRKIGVLYSPSSTTSGLTVRVHYNNSSTYRPNAVQSDRGDGTVAYPGGVVIDMRRDRSALGQSTGYSTVRYSGRASDMSSGGDRHLAIDLSGTQSADPVSIHSVTVAGVT